MKRSKKFLITKDVEDSGMENLDEFMSRFDCKNYYAVFHPKEVGKLNDGHYHIFVELYDRTDICLIQDYFGRHCIVDIPRDKKGKIFCYLSHNGFYKVNVNGTEIDINKD